LFRTIIFLGCVAVALNGCGRAGSVDKEHAKFTNLAPILLAFQNAHSVKLYVGLPHHRNEAELLEQEKKTKPFTMLVRISLL